jgi:phosphatidylinositol-3-phosphatase
MKSMNKQTLSFNIILLLFILQTKFAISQTTIPKPDHIVIAILESHGYSQLIGSSAAPYINSLATDSLSALFSESYAITHPSQPNYLVLFSGSTQGVKDNNVPSGNPFSTANLGRQLIDSEKTFVSYSEDLPNVGYNGSTSDYYARKHNPVTNWMGTGTNQISSATNQPFSAFPTSNFSILPTVCYVIPNLANDMHNGTDPERIKTGDKWISDNLDKYIQWAKTNNSLFILTFDEEGETQENHILTIFTGQMVRSGNYSTKINHYSVLNTIENMYGLPYLGDELAYSPITYCWKANSTDFTNNRNILNCTVYPNPTKGLLFVELANYQDATAEIYNLNGRLIQVETLESSKTSIKTDGFPRGFYLLRIRTKECISLSKILEN